MARIKMNNWQTKKLGEIISLEYGKGLTEWVRTKGDIPVYGSGGLVGTHNTKLVEGPGIIVGRKGSIGAVVWSDSDFWPIDTTYYVRLRQNEELRYIYFLLQTLKLNFLNKASGVPGLNRNDVYQITVKLPPFNIQRQIIERLDAIRKLQELNDEEIEKAEELHKSLINEEIKSKKYATVKLSEITKSQEFTNPKNLPDDEFQYVDISAIDSENFAVDSTKIRQFKGENAPSRARKKINEGDILFSTVRPNLKRIAKVDFSIYNSLASTGFAVLRPDDSKVNPDYMGTVTCSGVVTEQVLPQMKGASYPAISDNDVFNAEIPLPDRRKQNELAEKFLKIQEYRKGLVEQKNKLSELFESTLNKAMKGELIS